MRCSCGFGKYFSALNQYFAIIVSISYAVRSTEGIVIYIG